jgi:hypothetical protein
MPRARRHLPRALIRPGHVSFAARPESHLCCPSEGNEWHWEQVPIPGLSCPGPRPKHTALSSLSPAPEDSSRTQLRSPQAHNSLSNLSPTPGAHSSPALQPPKIRAAHSSGALQAWIVLQNPLKCVEEGLGFRI